MLYLVFAILVLHNACTERHVLIDLIYILMTFTVLTFAFYPVSYLFFLAIFF